MKLPLSKLLPVAFLVAGAFGLAGSAQAATSRTFVSTSGSDTGACSPTAPCRTFAFALSQTLAGGEIVILNSGGYGPVTITQSVTLVGEGVHPAVTAASGNGITIAAASGVVALRGLSLIGTGTGTNGVSITAAASVVMSDMTIGGFQNGINIAETTTTSGLPTPVVQVKDTVIKGNSVAGVVAGATGAGLVTVTIQGCQILENATGILVEDQAHVIVDSTDVLYGATGVNVNAVGGQAQATAASIDVLYSNLGSNSTAVVSVNQTGTSTAAAFLGANTIIDANLAATTFVGGAACAPSATNTTPTCTITTDGANEITNQGSVGGAAATYSQSPATLLTSSATFL